MDAGAEARGRVDDGRVPAWAAGSRATSPSLRGYRRRREFRWVRHGRGIEPGEGAGGAATASDMDVEAGTAGPRVAAGGADIGAADGHDGFWFTASTSGEGAR